MKIVIRADASFQMGTGHVMRCLSLAWGLLEKGCSIQFICRAHPGNLITKVEQEGFKVHTLGFQQNQNLVFSEVESNGLYHAEWLGVTQQQDAEDCQSILNEINPDWLIVDHYGIDHTWQKQLRSYYQKLMVIDDIGDRYQDCDLLLDQNYGSDLDKYKNLIPSTCKLLAGPTYALLRPDFALWRGISLNRRACKNNFETLLITMGGADPDNYTGEVLKQLSTLKLAAIKNIIIVMGATALHLEKVQKQAKSMSINTNVKTNVSNMAEIMAYADLAIGASGSTSWERCCLWLPTIQMVIAENQRQIASTLAKDKVVLLMDNIKKLPELLVEAQTKLVELSQFSADNCDGKGVLRVCRHLLESKK